MASVNGIEQGLAVFWEVFKSAPLTTIAVFIVLSGMIWTFIYFIKRAQVDGLKAQVSGTKEQVKTLELQNEFINSKLNDSDEGKKKLQAVVDKIQQEKDVPQQLKDQAVSANTAIQSFPSDMGEINRQFRLWEKQRFNEIHRLKGEGHSVHEIIRLTGLSEASIHRELSRDNRSNEQPQENETQIQKEKPLTAKKKRNAQREAFLSVRKPLEEAVRNASGARAKHEFDKSGLGQIELTHEGATYVVPISKLDGIQIYMYNTHDSIKWLAKVGEATQHEIIDIRELMKADREISIKIGECAILEMKDGKLLQVLLVSAQVRADGDYEDDARIRYQFYKAGEFQIEALRNGTR